MALQGLSGVAGDAQERSWTAKFPLLVSLEGQRPLVIHVAKEESSLGEVYDLFLHYADVGVGFSISALGEREVFVSGANKEYFPFRLTDEETGEMVGSILAHDSPMCRSSKPMLNSFHTAVNPGNKGIGRKMVYVGMALCKELGYYGTLARIPVNSMAYYSLTRKYFNALPAGLLPYSLEPPKVGWIDDVSTFVCYSTIFPDATPAAEAAQTIVPAEPSLPSIASIQPDSWSPAWDNTSLTLADGQALSVHTGSTDDKLALERLIHDDAKKGRSFASDEFTEDGVLNRKFFHNSMTLVAEDAAGTILGGAIFGPSSLCREPHAKVLGVYTIAANSLEMEKEFYRLALKKAEEWGMMGVTTDVFQTDTHRLMQLQSLGFVVNASMPFCAYLSGQGYVHSLVLFVAVKRKESQSLFDNIKLTSLK